jgi:hypothetical protein
MDAQPRDDAIVFIKGLALSLEAQQTDHAADGEQQTFRLHVGQRSTVVNFENRLVDQVLSGEDEMREVRARLIVALAELTAPDT